MSSEFFNELGTARCVLLGLVYPRVTGQVRIDAARRALSKA